MPRAAAWSWHDDRVTDEAPAHGIDYDRVARGYARWWAPVLAPDAVRVLDAIEPLVAAGARRLLDVGTGTATLAVAAIRRWPDVEVVGIDASSGMAAAARHEVDAALEPADRGRFDVRVAFADELPFEDGAFDAAISSFVLQLVPSRPAVLREVHRVLRPDGRFAHVTWIVGRVDFEPDRVLDDVLDEAGFGPREGEERRGDYENVATARRELTDAGFKRVHAAGDVLAHAYTADGYASFVEEFDEEDLFANLEADERARISGRLRAALAELSPDQLEMRLPIVLARRDR